jgi:hypothetical protein
VTAPSRDAAARRRGPRESGAAGGSAAAAGAGARKPARRHGVRVRRPGIQRSLPVLSGGVVGTVVRVAEPPGSGVIRDGGPDVMLGSGGESVRVEDPDGVGVWATGGSGSVVYGHSSGGPGATGVGVPGPADDTEAVAGGAGTEFAGAGGCVPESVASSCDVALLLEVLLLEVLLEGVGGEVGFADVDRAGAGDAGPGTTAPTTTQAHATRASPEPTNQAELWMADPPVRPRALADMSFSWSHGAGPSATAFAESGRAAAGRKVNSRRRDTNKYQRPEGFSSCAIREPDRDRSHRHASFGLGFPGKIEACPPACRVPRHSRRYGERRNRGRHIIHR